MTTMGLALFLLEDGTMTSLSEWICFVGSIVGIVCFIWRRKIVQWRIVGWVGRLLENWPEFCPKEGCARFLGWGGPKVNGIPTTHCPYCKTKL